MEIMLQGLPTAMILTSVIVQHIVPAFRTITQIT